MSTIAFAPDVAPAMKEAILARLSAIEAEETIRILFAIESGSRAWGFPSPDSDYDVRFVYARRLDWYLSIAPGRDVIEQPIEAELDINGWDIRKALGLLIKPNPVLLEWLSSPIRYLWDEAVCQRLIALSRDAAHGSACLNHYLHLGERQWNAYAAGKPLVNLKKYFYMVRPAMAVRWIRMHPDVPPPMNFQALLAGVDLPAELAQLLADLLERKSRSKELGEAPRIPLIDDFMLAEFAWAKHAAAMSGIPLRADRQPEADALFRAIVKQEPA